MLKIRAKVITPTKAHLDPLRDESVQYDNNPEKTFRDTVWQMNLSSVIS